MTEVVEADLANPAHAEALVRLLNEYALDPMGRRSELPDEVKANLAAELHATLSAAQAPSHLSIAGGSKQFLLVFCPERNGLLK